MRLTGRPRAAAEDYLRRHQPSRKLVNTHASYSCKYVRNVCHCSITYWVPVSINLHSICSMSRCVSGYLCIYVPMHIRMYVCTYVCRHVIHVAAGSHWGLIVYEPYVDGVLTVLLPACERAPRRFCSRRRPAWRQDTTGASVWKSSSMCPELSVQHFRLLGSSCASLCWGFRGLKIWRTSWRGAECQS